MNKSERELAMCHGKHGYATKAIANNVIRRTTRRQLVGGVGRLRAYKCDYCGEWHIGKTIISKGRD